MTQFSSPSKNDLRLKNLLKPALTAAFVGLLVAGCTSTSTTTDNDTDDGSMSSVGMMDDGSLSSAMMDNGSMSSAMMDGSSSIMGTNQSAYKDGTYSATGNYTSPAGQEQVDVTVTLAAGVITDSQFTGEATNPASKNWQSHFSSGYKDLVVGKSIDQVSLGVVNGSSLAPKGFMDALAKIKAEAQA